MGGFSGLGQFEEIRRVRLRKQEGKAVVTACHKARKRDRQETDKATDRQSTSFKFFWSQPFSVKQCQSAKKQHVSGHRRFVASGAKLGDRPAEQDNPQFAGNPFSST